MIHVTDWIMAERNTIHETESLTFTEFLSVFRSQNVNVFN